MSGTDCISHRAERERLLALAAAYDAAEEAKAEALCDLRDQEGEEWAVMMERHNGELTELRRVYAEKRSPIAAPYNAQQEAIDAEMTAIQDAVGLGAWAYDYDAGERVVCLATGLPVFDDEETEEGHVLAEVIARRGEREAAP